MFLPFRSFPDGTGRYRSYLCGAMSFKQKGSNNRRKQRLKVAGVHEHVTNQRNDFLQKQSSILVRENQTGNPYRVELLSQYASLHHEGGGILLPTVAESECTNCKQYIE